MCCVDEVLLRTLLSRCPEGPRIELGVFRGESLALISDHAGVTVGVDSFEGMAEPGPKDEPRDAYPQGRLAVPMDLARQAAPRARLVKGFVPGILSEIKEGPFAFAHIDLDHYEPTLASLCWLYELRMMTGGVVLCDDVFPYDTPSFANRAVHDFVSKLRLGWDVNYTTRMAWWVVR